jgi:hypothetical protein
LCCTPPTTRFKPTSDPVLMNEVDNIQGMGGKGELRLHNPQGHTAQ